MVATNSCRVFAVVLSNVMPRPEGVVVEKRLFKDVYVYHLCLSGINASALSCKSKILPRLEFT